MGYSGYLATVVAGNTNQRKRVCTINHLFDLACLAEKFKKVFLLLSNLTAKNSTRRSAVQE
jgi:hypothetical protein